MMLKVLNLAYFARFYESVLAQRMDGQTDGQTKPFKEM